MNPDNKRFRPIKLNINKLRVKARYNVEESMKREQKKLLESQEINKTPEEIETYFTSLIKHDEKSVQFKPTTDPTKSLEKPYVIKCTRESIEHIEIIDTDTSKTIRYDFENQMFYINNILEEDPALFQTFFKKVFQTLTKIGNGVEMLIEPID